MALAFQEGFIAFNASLSIDNLLIDKQYLIKLDRLSTNSTAMPLQAANSIYKVLFGNHLAVLDRGRQTATRHFLICSENVKF